MPSHPSKGRMRITKSAVSELARISRSVFGRLVRRLGAASMALVAIVVFVLWAHFGSDIATFQARLSSTADWHAFRGAYGIDTFGTDGYFTRAAQNGYLLFHETHAHGGRFTRRTERDRVNSCSACHRVDDLAYAFVNSDRFDPALGKRVSFEERVMRCYAGQLDGFVPTFYDPAIRDLRILARAVAHHLRLSEGARKEGG